MRKLISLLLAAAFPAGVGVALAQVQKLHASKPEQDPSTLRRIETMEKERAATAAQRRDDTRDLRGH